jgi:hypothetical protein
MTAPKLNKFFLGDHSTGLAGLYMWDVWLDRQVASGAMTEDEAKAFVQSAYDVAKGTKSDRGIARAIRAICGKRGVRD